MPSAIGTSELFQKTKNRVEESTDQEGRNRKMQSLLQRHLSAPSVITLTRNSPTVSQGSSLCTQKSVLKRQKKISQGWAASPRARAGEDDAADGSRGARLLTATLLLWSQQVTVKAEDPQRLP